MQNTTRIRHEAILEILRTRPVFNQEDLARRLAEAGIPSTQATLSRDLRTLRISKVPGEGYVLSGQGQASPTDLSAGILRIQFSGNLAVIRTRPGLANAVAILIDQQLLFPVIGTIAGDDTILLILKADVSRDRVLDALTPLFPGIKSRLII